MTPAGSAAAIEEIVEVFTRLQARAFLHACPIGRGPAAIEVALEPDAAVSAASVIKIVFAVAFSRAAVAGTIDPTERVEVPASLRLGGSGVTGFADSPVVSLRDLALSMLTVSDNAATDVIFGRVGRVAIEAVIAELQLAGTRVRRDMTTGAREVAAELGFPDARDLDARLATADPEAVRALGWLDPARSNAMTPRDATTLLRAVWTDQAGPPAACALVREMMAQQQNTQRLASGFANEVAVAGKTGTLPGIRNEAGVITYPDGQAYAISIFTRTDRLADRNAPLDAAIGKAAAIAVAALRADPRNVSS